MLGWGKFLAGVMQLFTLVAEYFRNQQLISAGRDQQKLADLEKIEELRREEQKIKAGPIKSKSAIVDELFGNDDK